jgi:hypothetical protein
MEKIKFRISLNKGREGVSLNKLGDIANETERFLKSLCEDMEIPKGEWIANNFDNGSVNYDHMLVGKYDTADVDRFNKGFLYVTSLDPKSGKANGLVSNETISRFAAIARPIDADEHIEFGIYTDEGGDTPKEWKVLTKDRANDIAKLVQKFVEYHGTIYGAINALFKGNDPHFTLRDIINDQLIRCDYGDALYGDIVTALKRRDSMVFVYGEIKANMFSKKIEEMTAIKIKAAPALTDQEYKDFFGCVPDMTDDCVNDE